MVLLLTSPLIILVITLQIWPAIPKNAPLTAREVSIVENLILNIAPESLNESSVEEASLDTSDVNLLIRHSLKLTGLSDKWNARISTEKQRIDSTLDWALLPGWTPLYLTIRGSFLLESSQLHLDRLTRQITDPEELGHPIH